MHETIERFYKSILEYAGLTYDPNKNIIVNISPHLGEFKVNGKYVTLPYKENLKHPKGNMIMHPLNENYVKPESSFFLAYKKRLTVEINLKICDLITKIINVASDPKMLSLVKSKSLIELFSSLNEVDIKFIDDFMRIIKKAMAEHEDGFIIDFILSKNTSSRFKYASAIGFVKFNMYNDVIQALEDKEYKLYKQPIRKRDLENLKAIHEHLFQGNLSEDYYESTENKRFRYLTVLLKTSYLIASVVNSYINLINSDLKLKDEERIEPLNTDWTDIIQNLYELDKDIRLIPNQDEYTESKSTSDEGVIRPTRLQLNEEDLKNITAQEQPTIQQPIYTPSAQPVAQTQQPMLQPNVQQTPVQQPLDPLQVLKQASMQQQAVYQQPMQMIQPIPMAQYQPQAPMPLWMQKELMNSAMSQPGMINQMPIQQPMGYPQYPQQGLLKDPQTGLWYMQTPNGPVYYNPNIQPMFPYMQQPRYTAG